MQIEFEATFLAVDKDEVRTRFKNAGARLVYSEFLMKRVVFHTNKSKPGSWLRVRQEADKVTMSFKQVLGDKIEDQKEIEIVVDNFDNSVLLLEEIGAIRKSYQETKRELWGLDGVQVTIDTWPGLNPFVEVEGLSEEQVKSVSTKLGFDYKKAYFGAVDGIYEQELGITKEVINNQTPFITFNNPPHI